jgi:ring-1,2-phenylacetyl-CoA epoxidase subunit PaaC
VINVPADPVATYAIRLGDDALVLAQRLTEWVSNAPTLEEELALANTALDFLGRARMFYRYAGARTGQAEEALAFGRDAREFTNLLIHELPRGDFAFTMARQYLVDAIDVPFLEALARSADGELAAIAAKAVKESRYHLKRSRDWIVRLGDGTAESRRRTGAALDELFGYTDELFAMDALEQSLCVEGVGVDRAALAAEWCVEVDRTLVGATLERPRGTWRVEGGRRGVHTEHLGHLLAELQFMQRAYPGLAW